MAIDLVVGTVVATGRFVAVEHESGVEPSIDVEPPTVKEATIAAAAASIGECSAALGVSGIDGAGQRYRVFSCADIVGKVDGILSVQDSGRTDRN